MLDLLLKKLPFYSAQRLVTLPATAQRLVDMVETKEAMVADTVVVDSVVPVKEAKPASHAVVTDIFPVTAPKDKSATTVVKSVISPATAHLRLPLSELATSASNLATSRLNAPTRSTCTIIQTRPKMTEDEQTILRKEDTPGIWKGWLAAEC